jgi:hypothetical protein
MTRTAFEGALDSASLWTRIRTHKGDRWYVCRRNGSTRVWKRDPDRFEVPVKFRLRDCIRVTSIHFNSGEVDQWFRIATENPNDQDHQ